MVSSTDKGFTLVEAMLAIAILLMMTVGSVAANRLSTTSVSINQARSKANNLAEEGMEALMSVRANDFLSIGRGEFHPVYTGTKWTLVGGPETLGIYTRKITISSVMRHLICFDTVCDITTEGGIDDEGTFKAEVLVTWQQGPETKEIKLDSLITYWR